MPKHDLLVQLVPVKLQALDELLDGALRLEREQREAERNVPPLARVFRQSETLAKLFDDVFGLFFLCMAWVWREMNGGTLLTFSIKEKM